MPIFTFPDEPEWDDETRAVVFTVKVGEYQGRVSVPRRVFQSLLLESPKPERCIAAFHAERARFERAVELKIARRDLTPDGNLELSLADLTGPRKKQSNGESRDADP